MAIEDRLPKVRTLKTGHPSSRVRKKLQALSQELKSPALAKMKFLLGDGPLLSAAQLLAELAEAQAEWDQLDSLRIAQLEQQRHIETRLGAFMDFVVLVRLQIRTRNRKPRRALTSAEKLIAAAKAHLTRQLRHTMGKR
jgi:hypothetical protein